MDTRAPDRTADTGQALSPALLSARDAAARIGVNERTIRRAIARGALRAAKHGGVFRIVPRELELFQADQIPRGPRDVSGARSPDGRAPPLVAAATHAPVPAADAPPPVRLLTGRRHDLGTGLPHPLTVMVGREREAADLGRLLGRDDVRLLTLTGPGGIGKTRLALHVAANVQRRFRDGVAAVMLASISDPDLVILTIAQALAVRSPTTGSLLDQVAIALRSRQLLLLVDNFEHLLGATPELAALLTAAPGLKALVTSRARLHLSGEYDYPIPPLTVPDPSRHSHAEVAASAAVRLFVARAQAVKPDFAPGEADIETVATICARLDGVPLAIELAAARSAVLPPPALLARLGSRLTLLTGGARDQPARLRSMRGAIAWSYDLLTAGEQRLFRRLTVFPGGCTVEAAEAIAGDDALDAFEELSSLVEKSLLRGLAHADREPRFGMLETIRDYGLEQLEASGEADAVRRRHADICLALVEGLLPRLKGAETIQGLDRLAGELPNIRAAVTWALDHGETTLALRLVTAIYPSFWFSRGDPSEGRRWLETGLKQAAEIPVRVRVDALDTAAMLTAVQGDYPRALALAAESHALADSAGYTFGVARADFCFGMIAEWRNDFDLAAASYTAALDRLRELGDPYWIAMPLTNLAVIRHRQGRHDQAAALADEGLAWWRAVGNPWGIAMTLTASAAVAADRNDWASAAALHREALGLWLELDDKRGIAGALAGTASVATHQGQPELAAWLLGAASAVIGTIGVAHPLHPAEYARATAATRLALGESAFLAAWEAGGRLPLAEAVTAAVALAAPPLAMRAPGPPLPFGLTAREVEIVRLLARRATNKEIATALFISPRTVGRHVDSILHKLGLDSRREVAALAAAHDLA